jgi:type I restriction enzyme S subunit
MIAHHAPVGRVPPRGATPPGRKKSAQGKERSAPALGHESQNTSSPEGAKEGRWPVVPLSEVVAVNPRPGKDEVPDDSLASFIPMKCVEEESGRFEPLGDRKVAEVRKGYTPFRDGDVLFAKVTPCMENGKAAVMKGLTNGIGFGSTEFFTLRPKDRLDANYLFHFVLQSSFRRQAARNMTGAVGLRRVPKSYLEQQPIPLPPLPDQRRIVAEIEKQFTRLEAGVAALRRVQANLKRYRAAVLKAACEGRLVPTDAELAKTGKRKSTFETGEALLARILTERRKNWQGPGHYKEPTTSATTNLPPLAEGWTWASVSQVSATIVDCPHSTAKFVEAGHPCVDTTCIKPGRIVRKDLRFVSQATFQVRVQRLVPAAKDIIFAREGTVGTAVAVPPDLQPCLGQRVMLMRPDTCIAPRYFEHSLNSHAIRSQYLPKIVGSTAPHLNVAEVKQLAIPLPPLAEQTRIVAEVERRLSVVEELEAVVSANLQRATRLRQSILQKAFTGELV